MTTTKVKDARRDNGFLGHPIGLGWLSGTEFWERFSFYGMVSLLTLYMTHQLLQPGHVEHIFGFGPFRSALGSIYGAHSPQAIASAVYGLYAGLVYLTPLGGGLLADRVIGRTRAITIGASLMALGHFLMAFDATFLVALLCLLTGVGCFKGNIATQVGELYSSDDPRRADAFQMFLLVVQVAVIGSPILCGYLEATYGWHWGFGAAGVGMLIGLATYLKGRKWLPPEPEIRKLGTSSAQLRLARQDWVKIAVLIAILPVLALSIVGNNQIPNAYMIWAESHYRLVFFGVTMPTPWLLSMDSVFGAVTIALSVAFWRWYASRWTEPDEIAKITIGIVIAAAAPLVLALASAIVASTGHKVSIGWAFAFETLNDIGFANILPVGLALYSRSAPKGLSGLMIGIYYLHLVAGNMLVGWLGGLLEKMPATSFWLLHGGLMFISAGILFVVRLFMGHTLAPSYDEPALVGAKA